MNRFLVQVLRVTKAGYRGHSRWFTDEFSAVRYADEKWHKMRVKGDIHIYHYYSEGCTTNCDLIYHVECCG